MSTSPLASIQLYAQGIIDGLVIGGGIPPLEAFITPPAVDTLDRPKAYVLGGRLTGRRQTMPRKAGFKHLAWVIDIYLSYESNPNFPTIDTEFPSIVDAVMAAFWSVRTPTFVTPQGQAWTAPPGASVATPPDGSSQVLNVGEDFEFEYPPERAPATLRMAYYVARLGLDVYEAVQA